MGKFLPRESRLQNYNSKNRRWRYLFKKKENTRAAKAVRDKKLGILRALDIITYGNS